MVKEKTKQPTKAERKQIVSMFKGSKKEQPKTLKEIVEVTGIGRRSVMRVLQEEGLKTYSPGSFA